jgi:hypothetical protein
MKQLGYIGLPKRVGLLSFYVFDTGSFEFSALAATYGGKYFESIGLNERGANKFASAFADAGVPVLKEEFAARGMELLTPVEFLETDEQIDAYLDFTLPRSGYQKFAEGALKILDKNPHANGAADGYEMIPSHLWTDREILRELDALRVALGLDGLLVVSNNTATNAKSVVLGSIVMMFYGPNPKPEPEKFAKYWTPLLAYTSGTFGKGFKGVEFFQWKKPDETSYDGYDGIMRGLVTRTLDEVQKYADKGK